MTLNSSQKTLLRGMGQKLDVSIHVGKQGVTENLVKGLAQLFSRRELVKVRLPGITADDRKAMALALAQATGGELAGAVGKVALLYRANPALAPAQRIALGE